MFIQIDPTTILNAQAPIAYLEEVHTQENPEVKLTRITFFAEIEPLIVTTDKITVAEMIERELNSFPVFPASTDTPLQPDQLPFDGEDTVDYLNRVTQR